MSVIFDSYCYNIASIFQFAFHIHNNSMLIKMMYFKFYIFAAFVVIFFKYLRKISYYIMIYDTIINLKQYIMT